MSLEHGKLFVVNIDVIPVNDFGIASTDVELKKDDPLPDEFETKFYAIKAGLADTLFGRAIATNECKKGKNVLLFLNTNQGVKI